MRSCRLSNGVRGTRQDDGGSDRRWREAEIKIWSFRWCHVHEMPKKELLRAYLIQAVGRVVKRQTVHKGKSRTHVHEELKEAGHLERGCKAPRSGC